MCNRLLPFLAIPIFASALYACVQPPSQVPSSQETVVNIPPVPKSLDQTLFEVETAYGAALAVVTVYGAQKLCAGATYGLSCANGPLIKQANSLSQKVAKALARAQDAMAAYHALTAPTAADLAVAATAVSAVTSALADFQDAAARTSATSN